MSSLARSQSVRTPEPAATGGNRKGRDDFPSRSSSGQQTATTPRTPIPRTKSNPDRAPSSLGSSRKSDKKIDLTHLTNFTLAPREKEQGSKKHYRPAPRFNRERFLQANYRFLVKEGGDYTVHLAMADQMFEWDDICQINVTMTQNYDCPICLGPPLGAKITRCGHIFCWSCLLRLFAQNPRPWGPCPTCKDIVGSRDLKPAVIEKKKLLKDEETATFALFKRERGTVIPMHSSRVGSKSISCPRFDDDSATFCKFSTISDAQNKSVIFERELGELRGALREAVSSQEDDVIPFLEEAILSVLKQINPDEDIAAARATASAPSPTATPAQPDSGFADADFPELAPTARPSPTIRPLDVSASEFKPGGATTPAGPAASPPSVPVDAADDRDGLLFFFQTTDGQRAFLHPINQRMLLAGSGTAHSLPATISGRILELEQHTQSEELRRRIRPLDHLPLGCEFTLIEMDMRGLVAQPILKQFDEELRKRDKRRKQRARQAVVDAENFERMSSIALKASFGGAPAAPLPEEFHILGPVVGRDGSDHGQEEDASATEQRQDPSLPPCISFARVVNSGYAALGPSISSRPVAAASTAWGASSTVSSRAAAQDGEEEDELRAPSFKQGWAIPSSIPIASSKDSKKKKNKRGALLISNSFSARLG